MARYAATVTTEAPTERVFEYLADFSTSQEWDPGVVEASRLTGGPVGVGSRFHVVARFAGRNVELEYEITAHEPGARVVLEAENFAVRSVDEIRVREHEGATAVTYDAQLRPKGVFRLFDPIFQLVFDRVGDEAAAGLRSELSGLGHQDNVGGNVEAS